MTPDSVRRAGFGEGFEAGENLFDTIVTSRSGVVVGTPWHKRIPARLEAIPTGV